MAEKEKPPKPPTDTPTKGRSFKADTAKFDSLAIGESLTGIFMGVKDVEITDTRTRQPKTLFVIKLRANDKVLRVPCAAMLMQTWEELVDEYGNGNQEAAIRSLHGRTLTINRGLDTRTRDGNQMGTYEIIVHE